MLSNLDKNITPRSLLPWSVWISLNGEDSCLSKESEEGDNKGGSY